MSPFSFRSHGAVAIALFTLTLTSLPLRAAPPRMSVEDLLAVKWISQVSLSPDGRQAAFVVSVAELDKNKRTGHIYAVSTDGSPGALRQLTNGPSSERAPAFSPDGRMLAFVSSRGGERPQIWLLPVDGGEAAQLTSLSTGASGPVWSPDGKSLAFVSSVFPDCKGEKADACNAARLKEQKKRKATGRVIDHLLYRHWNEWRDERRQHVLLVTVTTKKIRDLTPGPHDAPPIALGGEPDITFSPDGRHLAYVSNTDEVVAASTNNDVFEVPLAGGRPRRLSRSGGNDNSPRYSPDGRHLAYLSMTRPGYESDRPRILVQDRRSGKEEEWTRGFDGHPLQLLWGPESKTLFFTAPRKGQLEIFSASRAGVRQVSQKLYVKALNVSKDGRHLVFISEAAHRPPEIFRLGADGRGLQELTRLNNWLTGKLKLQPAEHHWFKGAAGQRIHAVLVKPPGLRKGTRYPALVMIHGGPQGMTGDSFHPRWNLQMFAAHGRGMVVFGINFHGSVGFGQPFCDSIRGDWGGKPLQDILLGTDYLAGLPFVRPRSLCAAGASYGGYLINWIATQTSRFSCLISHAGLFNLESKYGSTEELWFPEWDMMGTPWSNRELYRKWSPHSHAEKLKTPTLVIHGQQDFRVPVEQGFQLFTALKRQGVPSRLLYFPDEDHFVSRPHNVKLWWKTMRDWLERYLR